MHGTVGNYSWHYRGRKRRGAAREVSEVPIQACHQDIGESAHVHNILLTYLHLPHDLIQSAEISSIILDDPSQ